MSALVAPSGRDTDRQDPRFAPSQLLDHQEPR
uniref:Uncharacterized protein n=1 Tax=Arundo donax TaxID=35708 RepID=A0A0A9FFP5_ARUDO